MIVQMSILHIKIYKIVPKVYEINQFNLWY